MGCLFMILPALVFSTAGLFGWSEYQNRDLPIPCDAEPEELVRIVEQNWHRTSLWERFYDANFGDDTPSTAFLERVECEE